ncbi:MAG: tRNA (adenosine(37)-N6)-threonylcarbamoyltransferase complex dimerization subunit type 1 TsaB [Desulfobacterales bacterium]|nr:tRNA (adenosine(37)-N6)-threonylcarbamoyltransferase complex dimerization subunit type 1 TsaB [Desulfobacterales bacterium]
MKIFAIDTATKTCSIAITNNNMLLSETILQNSKTHSIHLMDIIYQMLKNLGITIHDIDAFAVTKGPGSFTGLRIGISSIKGLASATGKPVIGISTLDALSYQIPLTSYLICSILDARKGSVYFAKYIFENGVLKNKTEEQVLSPDEAICDITTPSIFIGDGAQSYKKEITSKLGKLACFLDPYFNIIRGYSVANLAFERLKKNDFDDLSLLKPYYIRKSEAELKKQCL